MAPFGRKADRRAVASAKVARVVMVIKNCGKAVVAALTAIAVTTLFAGNDANPDAIELVPLPQPAKFCYFKVGLTYFEIVQRQFGVKKGILRGQTLLAVLEILSGQAAILRDMVSLEFRGDTPFGKLG